MPEYSMISGKVVLARVIRALGYKLPSVYHDDILEWIPEGMGEMEMTNSLIKLETGEIDCPGELILKNHCVPLPCGFQMVVGVYDEDGAKLVPGDPDTRSLVADERSVNFSVNPYAHQTSTGLPTDEPGNGGIPWDGSDLSQFSTERIVQHFYVIKGNMLQSSKEEGYIKMRYYSVPVCEDGYPLIPNNENFKQALEWHIIRKLIGSGYEHKVFTFEQANAYFEIYAGRAMAQIAFPSPDKMARVSRVLIRLIPPARYAEDYFINT
jgi:hypothetical protein